MPVPIPPAVAEADTAGFRALHRLVLRCGPVLALLVLTVVAATLVATIAGLVVRAAGRGDPLVAALAGALGALPLVLPLGLYAVRLAAALEQARERLTVLATHDELTGVHNRRHFMDVGQREWDRARRYDTPAALLLVDADHFKRVNDGHGHRAGDELLRSIARTVGQQLRQADVLARFGGEELAVFLPHTDPLGALDVAERIREQVQSLSVPWQSARVGTTVSVGVAPLRSELPSFDWMIHEAETALMAAKADGRNCVRTLPFEPSRSGGAYPVNSR